MAISTVQRNAFVGSPDFVGDFETVWLQEGMALLDKADVTADQKQTALNIMDGTIPYSTYMVPILADGGWTLSFDKWEADRTDGMNHIRAGVQKVLGHLE